MAGTKIYTFGHTEDAKEKKEEKACNLLKRNEVTASSRKCYREMVTSFKT